MQLQPVKLLSLGPIAIREADGSLLSSRMKRLSWQPRGIKIVAALSLSKTPLLIPILFAAVACAGNAQPPSQAALCPQDAKICPDGSFVARSGPHCEMAACPLPKASDGNPGAGSSRPKLPRPKLPGQVALDHRSPYG